MLALYRSGRQAEALRRCADLRSMLRHEMGLSVSPAARELEARILSDDPSLHHHVGHPARATPGPLPRREPTQLIGAPRHRAGFWRSSIDSPSSPSWAREVSARPDWR